MIIATCCARYRHAFAAQASSRNGKAMITAILTIAFFLIAVILVVTSSSRWESNDAGLSFPENLNEPLLRETSKHPASAKDDLKINSFPPKKPPYMVKVIDGVEMYISLPPQYEQQGGVKGVLLAFHGCSHSGLDWFRLPEEGVIVRHALTRQVAVVAFTSYDRHSGCWSLQDRVHVPNAFTKLQDAHAWAKAAPLFAIGASSGGSFVSSIPADLSGIRGLMIQIARPNPGHVAKWHKPLPKSVYLVGMTGDPSLAPAFKAYSQSDEVKAARIRVRAVETSPCAVTPKRLMERVYDMTQETADSVVAQLVKRLILHHDTFHPLVPSLYGLDPPLGSDDMFLSIQEEIKVCYAQHELTAEFFPEALAEWLN